MCARCAVRHPVIYFGLSALPLHPVTWVRRRRFLGRVRARAAEPGAVS